MIDLTSFTYEELAHALYVKGEMDGYRKITDKTKWHEAVTAEKLNHVAFTKISAGKNSDKYGADASNPKSGKMAEYKSQTIEDKDIRNLLQHVRNAKTGARYSPLNVAGVYNGAYNHEAIDAYEKHEHYFTLFHKELCIMIIRPKHDIVISQLRAEVDKRLASNSKKSTNLNTVKINLGETDTYDIVWKRDDWFEQHKAA